MTTALRGLTVGILERPDALSSRGALVHELVAAIRRRGGRVRVVLDDQPMRLDAGMGWDVTLLKAGSASALHLAAAAEGFGIPSLNDAEATRLARDRAASTAVLAQAGLPVAPAWLLTLNGSGPRARDLPASAGDVLLKAAGTSRGEGLWRTTWDALPSALTPRLPPGAYVATDLRAHGGDDLKLCVAGGWVRAIRRPFPARTLDEKRGRPVIAPHELAQVARRVGRVLGLRCYACDFVATDDGWRLMEVTAFPGYRGVDGAAEAIAAELERLVERAA